MTTEFIMKTLICVISMEFLSLSRRRSYARNVPSGEERGETDVFAGYSTLQCIKCITNPECFSDYESTTWFSFKINKVISSCAMIFFSIFSAQHFKVENASQTRNISQVMNLPRGFLFIQDLPSLT